MNASQERIYELLSRYQELLCKVDDRAEEVRQAYREHIHCGKGCTDCCHQPFDISWLEGFYLWIGLNDLDADTRRRVRERAAAYLEKAHFTPWGNQTVIEGSREDREARMQLRITEMNSTHLACPLLEDGACLLYEYRPSVCRVAGYPLPDPVDDAALYACYKNFVDFDLSGKRVQSFDVDRLYAAEADLERELLRLVTGREPAVRQMTQVAGAMVADYDRVDWAAVFRELEGEE